MAAFKWPDIRTDAMRAMARGRDKNKSDEAKYTRFAGIAETKMPCGETFLDRHRDPNRTRAMESAKQKVISAAKTHIKSCDVCKAALK